jgi:hypothetical protein
VRSEADVTSDTSDKNRERESKPGVFLRPVNLAVWLLTPWLALRRARAEAERLAGLLEQAHAREEELKWQAKRWEMNALSMERLAFGWKMQAMGLAEVLNSLKDEPEEGDEWKAGRQAP